MLQDSLEANLIDYLLIRGAGGDGRLAHLDPSVEQRDRFGRVLYIDGPRVYLEWVAVFPVGVDPDGQIAVDCVEKRGLLEQDGIGVDPKEVPFVLEQLP